MRKFIQVLTPTFIALLISTSVLAQGLEEKIQAAMKMDYRTAVDTARDADRMPVQALVFMGLGDDLKVIEFLPEEPAWYTKILAPVLSGSGKLYVMDAEQTFESWGKLWDNPAFRNVSRIPLEIEYIFQERRYRLGELNIGVTDADMFLNVREYHNFNAEDKQRLNTAVYNSLKPGGRYVIIDHSRRHNQPKTQELARREDPVQVIQDVQAAGFVLEKSSDMFFRPDDGLNLEVGNESVTGKTDRFFLVFRKP